MTTFPAMPNGADHVLVASPNSVVRERILESLARRAGHVEQASGGAEALVHLERGSWQFLLLDRRLPDLDAEELSQTVRARYPTVEVVLIDHEGDGAGNENPASGGGDVAEVEASANHVTPHQVIPNHVSTNHVTPNQVSTNQGRGLYQPGASAAGRGYSRSRELAGAETLPGMIGNSASMQSVYRMASLVATRDTTVLITGPTGSGKELIARALHQLSPRAARTLAVVNCAAIPETLLEAELFGYSRGAFTGALQSYGGRIQAAHQGTLFLDEIGDMPLSLQPKLLRFLEQKELQRLGSTQVVRVDARVVAATNADLLALVRQGRFREDLYYRLSAFPLALPPLSERPGDVIQLAAHFLEKLSANQPVPVLSEEAAALLLAQSWPGNVRELQNVMERALILANGEAVVRPVHLLWDMGLRG